MVMAMNKCVEVGDCHSDLEIDFLVGKRLNPKAWPWDNVADFFTEQLHNGGVDMTFEDLQDQGWLQMDFEYRKYEKGLLRPDGEPGFNTPTGLVGAVLESMYEDWGEDPLPYFDGTRAISPLQHAPTWPRNTRLCMTTGGRETTSFHSEHRQVASLRCDHAQPAGADQPRNGGSLRHQKTATGCASRTRWAKPSRRRR